MTGQTEATRVATATVMFTDLVDSTSIRVRLGEVESERLRRRHDGLVRAAVVAHSGRVAKHTGDGVMAVFEGAADAMASAVAVQQSIDSDNRRGSQVIHVRIGISAGDVTIDGDDCFGLPVVEAQRLETAAMPGQILVSFLVSALARGRGGHELRSIGALNLKGLDAPVEVQEVVWSPLAGDDIHLPPALIDHGGFPFAGRSKSMELLSGAWMAAVAGATRVVLISGEPGIGKTRLAGQIAGMVVEQGGSVLAGRCDEMVGAPYQPFREALRFQIGRPDGVGSLGAAPQELVRLVPEVASVLPDLPPPISADPDAERLRLFEAVASWLGEMTARQPLTLVLDDLHWADAGSLLLLRHLVANEPVPHLLVVGTYRDTDLDRTHPLSGMLGELRRRAEVSRIPLEGLDSSEVTDLLATAAGHELAAEGIALARAVRDETGGNPFFVGEVLRHLAETGAIVRTEGGRWQAGLSEEERLLPEGIREVVGRRLSALPELSQKALSAASVIGVEFDLNLLADVSGEGVDALADAVEPALRAQLLTEAGYDRYRFAHALVRQTLHSELSTSRRGRLHRAVAQALEARHAANLDAFAPELAYHWAEAGPAAAHEQAVSYAVRSAELAWSRAAPEEAARWYGQARELLDGADPHRDAELAVRRAEAMALAGAERWHEMLIDAARVAQAIGSVSLVGDAFCSRSVPFISYELADWRDTEKVELLDWAIGHCPAEDRNMWARLAAALVGELIHTGDSERRRSLFEEVLGYLSELEDPVERFRIREILEVRAPHSARRRSGFEQSLADYSAAAELAAAIGDLETEALALSGMERSSLALGLPTFREVNDRRARLLARYPNPREVAWHLRTRMCRALVEGRLSEAEALADEFDRRYSTSGWYPATLAGMPATNTRFQVSRERVGMGWVLDLPRSAVDDPSGRFMKVRLVLALSESGRHDEAKPLIDEKSAKGFGDLADETTLPVAECMWSEAAALSRHERACHALYDRMLAYADIHQWSGVWYLGATARYLGLLADALGRHEEADDWFSRAQCEHERIESPTWLARGLLDWAEARHRRGDLETGRSLAARALDAIGDLELDVSRSRAERILSS